MKPGIPHTTTALALQIDEQAKFHLPGTHNSVQSIIRKLTRLIVGPVKYRKDLIQYSLSETAEPKLGLFERDRSCDFLFHPDLLKKTSEHLSHDQNPNYSELLGNVDSLFKKLENEADEILRSLDKCFNLDLYKKMESLPERKRKLMRMVLYEPNRPIFIPEHFDHSGLTFQVASSRPSLGNSFPENVDEIAVLAGLQGEIATNAVLKAALCEKIEKTSVAEQRWTISFYVNFDTARTPHELSEFEKTKMIWNSEEFAKGVAIAKDVAVI